MLWLTAEAVRNERDAIGNRQENLVHQTLRLAGAHVDNHWQQLDLSLARDTKQVSPQMRFATIVASGIADSVIVLHPSGEVAYPTTSTSTADRTGTPLRMNQRAWQDASRLEYAEQEFAVAADAYKAIALVEDDPREEALAWQAHARCLHKSGRIADAIHALRSQFETIPNEAYSLTQRQIWVDAHLAVAQWMKEIQSDELPAFASSFHQHLSNYELNLPSEQRLMAMSLLRQFAPACKPFATEASERLAVRFTSQKDLREGLRNGPSDEMATVLLRESGIVLLFSPGSLETSTKKLLLSAGFDDGVEFQLKPKSDHAVANPLQTASENAYSTPLLSAPHYDLVAIPDAARFPDAEASQSALYSTAGITTILIASLLAIVLASIVRRQLNTARLKNDLAAIVAHELRTPLASMRAMVDLMLDEETALGDEQKNEYLHLIAGENARLSRLVEDVLTLSRAERGQGFVMANTSPATIYQRTINALGQRIKNQQCELTPSGFTDAPDIRADEDAMVIVLTNLIDNAIKFSDTSKKIEVDCQTTPVHTSITVTDHGIGMTQSETKRVHRKYYQSHRGLDEHRGGCGLGLSLVHTIVKAHGGDVAMESELGVGTTVTVTLPRPQ